MEGVERCNVRLMPHNDKWQLEFLQVKKQVEKVWRSEYTKGKEDFIRTIYSKL